MFVCPVLPRLLHVFQNMVAETLQYSDDILDGVHFGGCFAWLRFAENLVTSMGQTKGFQNVDR